SMLSRWKIFDNLRRSLTAAELTLLLLLGWAWLPFPGFWTLAVMGIIVIPALTLSALSLFRKTGDVTVRLHFDAVVRSAMTHFLQAVFIFACLPHEAFFSLDAVLRTFWRMLVSQRQLLQWNLSDDPDRKHGSGFVFYWRSMWANPVIAAATAMALAALKPAVLAVAGPILVLWFVAPAIAWWLSRPLSQRKAQLGTAQVLFLRKLARKNWAFFETFVGPEDHWLPPDNVQEHPVAVTAHRTSPTNIGLTLLANLSANDFGAITAGELIERTTMTLQTMGRLERHRGHFYNWYDTLSLKPLLPRYISSVDSGNLAGHLLVLRIGLLELADHKILEPRCFESLSDTLEILIDLVTADPLAPGTDQLMQLQQELQCVLASPASTLLASVRSLKQLAASGENMASALELSGAEAESPARWWAQAFARQCDNALQELTLLAPWAELLSSADRPADFPAVDDIPSLRELAEMGKGLHPENSQIPVSGYSAAENTWRHKVHSLIEEASQLAHTRIAAIQELALQCEALAQMEYDFLYDKKRHLLTIGYNVGDGRRDSSHYDLLASEARFSSFVAIAQGKLPQESWFALGRLLTTASRKPLLLSWSGSMFEYLMPLLVMPTYEHTLLDQTYQAVVTRQIEYGKLRRVPWGVSECGYNAIDVQLNYQYCARGVPGLGLKRGLAEDLVIAPYASALALMVAPEQACLNLERLSAEGYEARYGFYEAIDFTPSRLHHGQTNAVVRSFMAHHQGMTLLSLAHLLLDRPMQRRFESDPMFQATLLLLKEQIPKTKAFHVQTSSLASHQITSNAIAPPIRVIRDPDTPVPEVQLLSNGRYHVMVTHAGGGYSRWKDLAITRWREDQTCDNWGTFCYLRDVESKEFWSATHQPAIKQPKNYEAIFSVGRAEFRGSHNHYDTYTEIAVSPEDDIELRRIRITNRARLRRTIEVTSYAEVVLAPPVEDALHPAFSNLFLQTEIFHPSRAILCTRRPRSQGMQAPWMLHMMAVHGQEVGEVSYETDRMRFIGRGNT
ncbi:MAG: hypothetical protein OEZ19_06605, partial [Paracoccaceae bacterium]|nr:hypothetical protein [Paracoccaceae bacterium]